MPKATPNDYKLTRQVYKHCYGEIPTDENGRKYHIHHIDGNALNNHPANLQAVSILEHYRIHYNQKDWGACHMLWVRMKETPDEISNLAKLHNQKRVEDGTHNLLDGNAARKYQNRLIKNGTHLFQKLNNKTYECPHCQLVGHTPAMKRWHFDNCKEKEYA